MPVNTRTRHKVGTTPVLSKTGYDSKTMYSYDNCGGVNRTSNIYEAATDSGDSLEEELSEHFCLPSFSRQNTFKSTLSKKEESVHSSVDSLLSHPSLGLAERPRTDSLKVEYGSSVWRYITPSPRSLDEREFSAISDEDTFESKANDDIKTSNDISSTSQFDTDTSDSGYKTGENSDVFWIPDTLARHMGIQKKRGDKKRNKHLKRITERVYADDEEIFMSVQNNLGKINNNQVQDNDNIKNIYTIRNTTMERTRTNFPADITNKYIETEDLVIENDNKNNNKEVQLNIQSLILTDNIHQGDENKKIEDWINFDDDK